MGLLSRADGALGTDARTEKALPSSWHCHRLLKEDPSLQGNYEAAAGEQEPALQPEGPVLWGHMTTLRGNRDLAVEITRLSQK